MLLDMAKIAREGGALEVAVSPGALAWERGAQLETSPFHLRGRVRKVKRGWDMEASLSGVVNLECSRCLAPYRLDLGFDFHLLFVPGAKPAGSGATQAEEEECDLYPCDEGKVDIAAVVKEQIYLQIPLKPLCGTSCRGLCRGCGEDLNRGSCRCGAAPGGPVA